jgi:hypothetical protein
MWNVGINRYDRYILSSAIEFWTPHRQSVLGIVLGKADKQSGSSRVRF